MRRLLSILIIACLISSCETGNVKRSRYSAEPQGKFYNSEALAAPSPEVEPAGSKEERVVIYDANLELTVKSPDSTNARLTEIANRYAGYALTLGNKESVIRVKAAQLPQAITAISTLGKLRAKVISGNDVTARYMDMTIRLENANKARKRYLELLQKAENVEAALKVEKELERLNGEIDGLEGNLRQMKHLSEYSTITVHLEEKVKPGILGYIGIGLYRGIKWLIVRN